MIPKTKNYITQMTTLIEPVVKTSQSAGLSKRHKTRREEGKCLNDDSKSSEKLMMQGVAILMPYAVEKIAALGGKLYTKDKMSLYECQQYFHKAGGPVPNEQNKNVFMKPDGGIFMARFEEKDLDLPIIFLEDKRQGTNDERLAEGKDRQSTGNAVERAAKNIRGAEMVCAGVPYYPYTIFASGCDFHSCETIAKRLEMGNMGFPNHNVELAPETTSIEIDQQIGKIADSIRIQKCLGHGVASVFVKTHKWDKMAHGSSAWTVDEMVILSKKVIDLAIDEIAKIVVA
jgi:hypothetical protein